MPRRGKGEGSVFQRSDGRWCARWTASDGRRRSLYRKTRADAAKGLRAALDAQDRGEDGASGQLTVQAYLQQWLEGSVRPRLRPLTFAGYETIVRLHLTPTLGRIRLDRLTPAQVQTLLNKKLAEGHSPKHVTYMRQVLRTALEQAQRWSLVPRNVADAVPGPGRERKEILPLGPEEARRFVTSIKGERHEALYLTALTLGLREGEVLGLGWEDVDLEGGSLRVRRQLQRIAGESRLVAPKSDSGRRTLALPGFLIDALHEHRARQLRDRLLAGERWRGDWDLVFMTTIGTPLDRRKLLRDFDRVTRQAGLVHRRFHDLRHSAATLLLAKGVPARLVMELLGHSEFRLTMDLYSHVVPEMRREAADRMQDLFGK